MSEGLSHRAGELVDVLALLQHLVQVQVLDKTGANAHDDRENAEPPVSVMGTNGPRGDGASAGGT